MSDDHLSRTRTGGIVRSTDRLLARPPTGPRLRPLRRALRPRARLRRLRDRLASSPRRFPASDPPRPAVGATG
ncbi:hypothetical protein [Halorubrum tebenquichense]|uniref:Uncharacterized protein n=1 Tax=Halorubrum tebenquichense DSM 14210 TaxID=1227485 RepID=M0DSZ5_9EURY|nr:hypothetical protein [Halorubrum tebenquichense]ELZ38600.1 hypothetical protein C472_06999 [Halorubrum tebenquichense DSM 14210]